MVVDYAVVIHVVQNQVLFIPLTLVPYTGVQVGKMFFELGHRPKSSLPNSSSILSRRIPAVPSIVQSRALGTCDVVCQRCEHEPGIRKGCPVWS